MIEARTPISTPRVVHKAALVGQVAGGARAGVDHDPSECRTVSRSLYAMQSCRCARPAPSSACRPSTRQYGASNLHRLHKNCALPAVLLASIVARLSRSKVGVGFVPSRIRICGS